GATVRAALSGCGFARRRHLRLIVKSPIHRSSPEFSTIKHGFRSEYPTLFRSMRRMPITPLSQSFVLAATDASIAIANTLHSDKAHGPSNIGTGCESICKPALGWRHDAPCHAGFVVDSRLSPTHTIVANGRRTRGSFGARILDKPAANGPIVVF